MAGAVAHWTIKLVMVISVHKSNSLLLLPVSYEEKYDEEKYDREKYDREKYEREKYDREKHDKEA